MAGSRMSLLNSGVRVGAAAFAVGLWLAGPQALGVANADTAAADSTSVSAGPTEPGAVSGNEGSRARSAAGRVGRGVKPSESTVSGVRPLASVAVTSVRQIPAGEAARRSVRASVSVKPAAAVPEVAVAVPSAAAVVADAAWVPAREQRGAAVRAAVAPVFVGDVQNVVRAVRFSVEEFLDTAVTWLSGLPSNQFTDFLTGGLWLVRRTLFPAGDNVGLGGAPVGPGGLNCVAAKDCSGLDLTGADLTGRVLTGVDFTEAILNEAIVDGADLRGADFTRAQLRKVDFSRTYYGGEIDGYIDGYYGGEIDGYIDGYSLPFPSMPGIKMAGADLTGANFMTTRWFEPDLTGANLTGARLGCNPYDRSPLNWSDLGPIGTLWFRAKLSGANLTNIQIGYYRVSYPPSFSALWEADLTNAEMKDARLRDVYLNGSDMTGANFWDELGRDLLGFVEQRFDVIWDGVTCPDGSKSGGAKCEPLPGPRPPRPWPWAAAAASQSPAAVTLDRRVNIEHVEEEVTA